MKEEHLKLLEKESLHEDIQELFNKCKSLIEVSRNRMSTYYAQWDLNDSISKNRMYEDAQDRRSKERKEPRKMVVPLTASQIDTFVSFAYMVLTQRENIYELEGTSIEDVDAARIASALLERDLHKSNFRGDALLQALQNTAKFNLGVLKHSWHKEAYFEEQEIVGQVENMLNDIDIPSVQTETVEKVTFLGNKIISVSPYKFFPDPRFPITRLQEGEFCGSEDEYSKTRLEMLQRQGVIAGLEYVQEINEGAAKNRRLGLRGFSNNANHRGANDLKETYVLTEVQIDLIPKDTMFGGKALGPEDYPVKYVMWYLNDNRPVAFFELAYGHNNFTYRPMQYNLDDTEFIGPALPDLLEKIQEAVSWFINSRITSVRKVIDNKLIVDPRGIDLKGLQNRDPILLLKPAAQGGDVNRYIKQLNVNDVTTNHLNDVAALNDIGKTVSGLTENLLGQFASGRRSATEARQVNANATARVKKIVDSIWHTAIEPMGRDMLANHRSYLDVPQLIKVIGSGNIIADPRLQDGVFSFMNVTKDHIQGNFDFSVYDGTLPSEKQQNAHGLQELLNILMSNPEVFAQLGYTPDIIHHIIIDILEARGVKNARKYRAQSIQSTGPITGGPAQNPGVAPPLQQEPDNAVPFTGTP